MIEIWQKISKKLQIKWNFELTVVELTVPDLYLNHSCSDLDLLKQHESIPAGYARSSLNHQMTLAMYYFVRLHTDGTMDSS